ncbi:cytochrome-c peroxidase [Vibrio hippocampi]|uniref:Cytochrome c551 peroxidase n=1 Tax=Vibrio hippocampi TaxID=654686 RepID=A0ABN8DN56_9VIBR|nr:cytochrome-c peroxidase [Vibrio hippocampi]CAH0529289.1 Cytochrome c551 peroxidase [Vibrio hippocampi]
MRSTKTLLLTLLLPSLVFAASSDRQSVEPVKIIEQASNINEVQAELGKMLFFDPRLSSSNYISCNSCHNLATGGVDNLKSSVGHKWVLGPINSPTVLNSELNFVQFWDGRAKDLQEQAAGPIENPKEMAFTHNLAVDTISTIPQYRAKFKQAYGSETITMTELTHAIAEFEKTLRTPNSRFDQWLMGDDSAITSTELAGYNTFKAKGCTACHNGSLLGGNMYQKMGIVKKYITDNEEVGRYAVTKNESDKFVFKVPTLRNIELTYPYFHDGAEWDLTQAVITMSDIQLGLPITQEEAESITAFLKTLTGEIPQVTLPHLPPSTIETPRPTVN